MDPLIRSPIFRKGNITQKSAQLVQTRLEHQRAVIPGLFTMNKETRGGVRTKIWRNDQGIIPQVRVKTATPYGTGCSNISTRKTGVTFVPSACNLTEGFGYYCESVYCDNIPVQTKLIAVLYDNTAPYEVVGPSEKTAQWEHCGVYYNEGQVSALFQNTANVLINDFKTAFPIIRELGTVFIAYNEGVSSDPTWTTILPNNVFDGLQEYVVVLTGDTGKVYYIRAITGSYALYSGNTWTPFTEADVSVFPIGTTVDGNYKIIDAPIGVGTYGLNQFGGYYDSGTLPLCIRPIWEYEYGDYLYEVYDDPDSLYYGLPKWPIPVVGSGGAVYYSIDADGNYWRGQYGSGATALWFSHWDVTCDGTYGTLNIPHANQPNPFPIIGRVSKEEAELYINTPYSVVVIWEGTPEPCTLFLPRIPAWEP